MDDTYIITVFVVFDELCQTLLPAPKYRPKMVPARDSDRGRGRRPLTSAIIWNAPCW